MNTSRQEIKINYNSEEWISDFDGGIASVEVDGKKLHGHESWRDWIRDRALIYSACILAIGISIGYISAFAKGNVISDTQMDKFKTQAEISKEGATMLHRAGARWDSELRDWVWSGNGLAISSHNQHNKRN